MNNRSIYFDETIFFRGLDLFRVLIKRILTKLRLRDKQSCKKCGRDQYLVWSVNDNIWNKLPQKYQNHSLCIECFLSLMKVMDLEDIKIIGCHTRGWSIDVFTFKI